MALAIGLDIGGTKCAVSIGREEADGLTILDKRVMKTAGGPDVMLPQLLDAARGLLAAHGNPVVAGAGISCGGPLDSARGLILSPPNLPGWDEVPVVETVSAALGVPAFLCNDADACALAEWRYGAGRGTQNMIFLTFGTGLGAGLILNGRLYSGSCGMAGEIGHVRLERFGPVGYGKAGSAEGFCSGGGIAQYGRSRVLAERQQGRSPAFCDGLPLDAVDAKLIGQAAAAGDALALAIYRECGEQLGRTLAILVDLLNPECIVVGSIFVRSYNEIWPAAEEVLRAEALAPAYRACRVEKALLGEQLGDMAALALAFYHTTPAGETGKGAPQ